MRIQIKGTETKWRSITSPASETPPSPLETLSLLSTHLCDNKVPTCPGKSKLNQSPGMSPPSARIESEQPRIVEEVDVLARIEDEIGRCEE
jgi:hypothetical protein